MGNYLLFRNLTASFSSRCRRVPIAAAGCLFFLSLACATPEPQTGTAGAGGKGGASSAGDAGSSGIAGTTGNGGTTGAAGAGGSSVGHGGNSVGGTAAGSGGEGGNVGSGGTAQGGDGGTGQAGSGGGSAGRGGAGGANAAGTGGRGGASGASGAAGGSSGASGGAGSSGSAGFGGHSLCTPGRFLLCEGFESTAVGNTPPQGWTRHGNASVAADQAARGMHAMKIAAAKNGERRFYFGDAESFGAAHWGRIFYKVQVPVPNPFVHSTIVALQGNGPTVGAAEYRVVDTVKNEGANATHQFLYNVQPNGSEFGKGGPYNWRFDGNWHCAEWFVDGKNQAFQFYFDGVEVQQIRIMNGAGNNGSGANKTDLPMVFSELRVGWNNYQDADPGFVAWVDEIAVDTARIGCQN